MCRFNDGRVELFQQLLWRVDLPQLAKKVQSLLGLFHNGLNVICPTSGPEKLLPRNLNDSTAVTVLFVNGMYFISHCGVAYLSVFVCR